MLGTGSAFAKKFYNNNALLETEGGVLLVDCGVTAPKALHDLGKPFDVIDAVLISHIHADHIGGLEELAFQMKFKYKRKPRLFIAENLVNILWEHSLRGGLEQDGNHSLDDYFDVRPLKPGVPAELLPGLKAELIPTRHIPNKSSYSFLFNDEFFYSADMVFSPELLTHLVKDRGVKIIFHDCQLFSPGEVHADLASLLTLPEEIQRITYLMHYGDDQPEYAGRTGHMRFVEQGKVYVIENGRVAET
jgi:glyoxylase-like metal-dependent hydrolase (beta-lactamase superfamily II)